MDDRGTTQAQVPEHHDDWQEAENTAAAHPGSAALWFVLMAALLGGLALMGAAFARGEGILFGAGLIVSAAAFFVPLELLGRRER